MTGSSRRYTLDAILKLNRSITITVTCYIVKRNATKSLIQKGDSRHSIVNTVCQIHSLHPVEKITWKASCQVHGNLPSITVGNNDYMVTTRPCNQLLPNCGGVIFR
eukprot:GFUD01094051.1.p1 GENE.GFUD01094051.1~~GFUD01094051.1.p1  ORF type:complete len:106 (-),score=12.13 GFUD01094051.1:301-618(-)